MTANEELKLAHISVGDMDNNVYLLHDDTEGLLIDAADNADAIMDMAKEVGVKITNVLTTHRHEDHTRALPEILERTGARHLSSFLDSPALPSPVDVELDHGDTIDFAGHELPVFILRGHTPGGAGVAARINGVPCLFVGDSLFPGGVGKTYSEGNFIRLFKDVRDRLFEVFRDESIVYPGHGDSTTLGAERPKLDEWWERRW
ncbi:Zn-dependent hydrolase [Corynebacterium yudongzhengii]|uniref:MBL fold metallo-hydrolase n=1 Tax=Corynebacterium yudongzhengii TaxID=2080740 RepID=A0A2U1T660_9CORY|nr:MBL fold metallo-hydrolase [Corynebacterium yudongzhengii]AWB82985.1 Zn-dependent hydrolase [Corynebacterium yudongzhengii]PWC01486.1 MBL fold metallo-hydrolase [Corynebacterium yudongzhengii]